MKAIVLDLTRASGPQTDLLSTSVSFKRFIDYVKETARMETSLRRTYLESALALLTAQPGFAEIKTIEHSTEFVELLNIVYQLLTPSLQQQEDIVWAIGMPLSPVMFYGTDSFYEMVMNTQTGELRSEVITDESVTISEQDKVLPMYSLVLRRLYGITAPDFKPMVISIKDQKTGMPQYFRINIDHRFTEVYPLGPLPEIDKNAIQELLTGNGDVRQLLTLLPVDMFRFEGISIITLTDVTPEYALEQIKTIVLEMYKFDHDTFYRHITDSLRILGSNPEIDFGLIPQLRVNNKLVVDRKTIFHSKLVSVDLPQDYLADIYVLFAEYFTLNPQKMFIASEGADDRLNRFVSALKSAGIQYYAIQPVYNGPHMVGLFEIYSTEKLALDGQTMSKISLAKSLISRIFQNAIDGFNSNIETVIKEKFTSIQNAVQWKFQQAAWHFLRDSGLNEFAGVEKIVFENVYPLYGAVDIRNSTLVRNAALRQDLKLQFDLIIKVLKELSQQLGLLLGDEMLYKCDKALTEILEESNNLDEMKVIEFLESEVHPFLRHFLDDNTAEKYGLSISMPKKVILDRGQILLFIQDYFNSIHPATGAAYANRRELEKSMQMINSTVNNALDHFKTQVQPLYPAYFEKFRTDGVEYDIYIGQSIDPDKKFSPIYLKNVKLWQLSSMASISKLTHALLPTMKIPLQTTQLIFVNSGTIDISFRDDERRFDVEGAYNIRYQVIKKRIDKVHIKETGERLTQPGKIALVYFQNKSASDYLDYIRFLQAQNVLSDDLEFLELEELQGVSGLKALRVGVNLDAL
ncbi:GAF domain-containing protein [Dyadobacter frigoris]|uniref:GAF domain-containing protein n=1 Tax=Dyadobacter frigoris TaxID=2576211 RepID=A0A4U6D0F8_9BACT|nr:GAF domain-containing protein [Dyadobacter frigoris]TKT90670.1 GAF domain-containing protein [Dyadobacter frigoris]GLU51175.1 hypothetical protein Dfri01_06360 [Dyadobacter frigoris]